MIERVMMYICMFLAVMVVWPFHEFAHGFAAVRCGDDTPKINGRYTLNPFAHFDLIGLICFVFVGFGWAKPVPVNPYNFKKYKSGMVWVSVAGVLANYILAFVVYPLFRLSVNLPQNWGYFDDVIVTTLYLIFQFNLTFIVFNLLPVYPLDGFRLIDATVSHANPVYRFLRNYGQYILLALIAWSFITGWIPALASFDILGIALRWCANIIGFPITWFWGLFF